MDWRAAFKGNFISAVEFAGKEPTLTIAGIKVVKVEDEKTKKDKDRLVIFFKETDRGWLPCKTNAICLAGIFGSNETDAWLGKRVTLYSTKVDFGKDKVDGIRVRGSPSLSAPVDVLVKLPKKKPRIMTMVPTGKPAAAQGRANGSGAPSPEPEPESAEQPDAEGVLPDQPEEANP